MDDTNALFCRFCDALVSGDGTTIVSELDSVAKRLALDVNLRVQMGTGSPSIWPTMYKAWDELSRQVALDERDALTRRLVMSLARFTRNLVAAAPSNQQNAFTSEPSLRRILHIYSSWSAIQDPQLYTTTRMLVQTLSNMVTSNDDLMTRLWETYMGLPEEQIVIVRLLGSLDAPTITSLLVLLINCMYESNRRRDLLVGTRAGAKLCIALLDRAATLYDAEESSDGGKAFDYIYRLFVHLFDGGFGPKLYASLKVPDEIIAPHQTTLLKLLDSYLHSPHASTALVGMCPILTSSFFEFCIFSTQAVRHVIGTDNVAGTGHNLPGNGALDLFLPKVCEALVLVTQCLVSALLEFEEGCIEERPKDELCLLIRGAISPQGQDMVACAIELLRTLGIFFPRINFGKLVSPSGTQDIPDPTGFSYIKRDLVRLLGVLCYKDRKMQDSIRNCEGIGVVMNMCVVDECNPYLREHAIFTLRNILEDNEENQNVVDNIRPSEKWDQDGR